MTAFFTFFFILTVSLIAFVVYLSGGIDKIDTGFLAKGKELGLTTWEIKTIKRLSDYIGYERPKRLLANEKSLNEAICTMMDRVSRDGYRDRGALEILEDIYKYKKALEKVRFSVENTIRSSREIDTNQNIKLSLSSTSESLFGTVLENKGSFLSIRTEKRVQDAILDGQINVYFWRENDAGYYFESIIQETGVPGIYNLTHSDSLIRSQKREDIRKDIKIQGTIQRKDDFEAIQANSMKEGATVFLKNISEGGCGFYLQGKIQSEIEVSLYIEIFSTPITIEGFIKESVFIPEMGSSFVRMRFTKLGVEALCEIRCFLFGIREFKKVNDFPSNIENPSVLYKNSNIIEAGDENLVEDVPEEVDYIPDEVEVFNQ